MTETNRDASPSRPLTMSATTEPSPAAISAVGVTRYYGLKRGVRELNLNVPTGSILGLLGENGCGKTTALKLAMGMLFPDKGNLSTLGVDPGDMPPPVRARIGWLSDQLAVPSRFRLEDAMALQRAYFPLWNQKLAFDLATIFGLTESSVFGQLSLGQKKRFMLLLVLAQMPELLVLDEPAGGLDPAVRRQLIEVLIDQAAQRPMTIVLSSHIMSDVERLVDSVAFMKDGRVIAQGDLDYMRARVKRICLPSPQLEPVIREQFNVLHTDRVGGTWRAVVDNFEPERLTGIEATIEHLNLEELFLVYNDLNNEAQSVR